MDRYEGPGFVFIGAGIGVTPLMSMMRTLADREDARPCYLFLCNRDWESITFREEIEELKTRLNLSVVHVLSHPSGDWECEKGHINATMLLCHLPKRYEHLQYFVCGPEAMMDATESYLDEHETPESEGAVESELTRSRNPGDFPPGDAKSRATHPHRGFSGTRVDVRDRQAQWGCPPVLLGRRGAPRLQLQRSAILLGRLL